MRLHDLARRLSHGHVREPSYWREHPDEAMALHMLMTLLIALLALATVLLASDALSHF